MITDVILCDRAVRASPCAVASYSPTDGSGVKGILNLKTLNLKLKSPIRAL
jgi:hypothetical protein